MIENKYYVPDITEFHVGFEHEKKDDRIAVYVEDNCVPTNWHKHIYDMKSIRLSQLPAHLFNKEIRVKYLDNSDIESFGFIHIGALWFEDTEKSYRIRKWKENEIDIYKWWGNEDSTMVFKGKIKNKSELQVLLKQLAII